MTETPPPHPSDTLSLVTAWKAASAQLKAARIDSPAIDARLLLEAAADASRM
ncbi:MAG: protein-(glutamine-N5) methyltransferase, release factor-specific, partial [Brevundimonas sp.]